MEARGQWRCGPRQCEPDVRAPRSESRSPTNLKWKFKCPHKLNDPEVRDCPGLKAPSGLDSEPGRGSAGGTSTTVPGADGGSACQQRQVGTGAGSACRWHSAQQRAGTLSVPTSRARAAGSRSRPGDSEQYATPTARRENWNPAQPRRAVLGGCQ